MLFSFPGHTENFREPFEGTTKNPGQIALGFYSGLFSYAGWYEYNDIIKTK